jgi:hypothetical protein
MSSTLRPTIEDLSQLGMHASYYNWGLQFISLPSALSNFTTDDLNTRAVSFSAPTRTQEATPIALRGHTVYQHGIMSYDNPLTLVLHETIDSKVGNFLEAWMDLQWTPIAGSQVPKSMNQASFLLTLLDSEDKARKYYTIVGAWITHFDHGGDYEATNSDTVKYTIQLQYDYYLST